MLHRVQFDEIGLQKHDLQSLIVILEYMCSPRSINDRVRFKVGLSCSK